MINIFIYIISKMTNRYDKLDHLLAFQQKSHYEHIVHPRATIRIEAPARRSHSLHYQTKTTHEKDRQRKLQNKKMLYNLLQIYNGQGLLSKMQQSSKKINEHKNKLLMRSFKKIEEEKQIRKQNKELLINIQNAGPMIGNKKDWNKHFEQHLEIQKKLCGYSVRNGSANITNFKTFYHQKKRRLISEEKGASERNSQQKQKNEEGKEEQIKKVHRKKKHRKQKQEQSQKAIEKAQNIEDPK